MVDLIIRDDDLNFFTKVEDVENVYKEINNFPVSFAIVPEVVDISRVGNCPETRGNREPRWIGNNIELTKWLKEKLSKGEIDVLMHGITHSYKHIKDNKDAEMEWRKDEVLIDILKEKRAQLEELLDYPISVFVAPSNKISKYGIQIVAKLGLNFSGIVPLKFERDITACNIKSYLKRIFVRVYNKIPYPGVLYYSDHLELNACSYQGYEYLLKMYNYCNERSLPMAINVHYWDMRDNPEKYLDFFKFIHWALDKGAHPARMSDVLNRINR